MVLRTILFILLMTKNLQSDASGFDAYSSCYRTSRKRQDLPCDFGSQTWCTIPGNSYPWHAVRRFVHENQGLMRRMYGDERHISVLRAELESNDIEYFGSPSVKEEFRRRYSKDVDGTKDFVKMFIQNEGRKTGINLRSEKTGKAEKIQKSIEEKSNNVLYQNHFKTSKEEDANGIRNESLYGSSTATPATTTTTRTTSAAETTVEGTATEEPTGASNRTEEVVQAKVGQSTPPDWPVTPPQPFRLTNQTNSNETQYEEFDYVADTEEPPTTTTTSDGLTTTEPYFEEVETEKDNQNEEEESVEGAETEEQETVEEPVSPQSPPMIRLKGINACPVKEEVVAPFWANNTRGEVLALLNLYPFEQYVHWEKCTYEHKQMFCREGCRCEQQYRLHRLLAYDPNNECRGIFSDWFRFPSCCVCKCYDLPTEFRFTSRSPRFQNFHLYGRPPSNAYNQPKYP